MPKPVFLSVVEFDELQHYKHRSPPWIKLYARLWENPNFEILSDINKAHYLGICVLASKHNNKIPLNISWIERHISATNPLNLTELIASGLLAQSGRYASEALDDCKQNALSERETEKRESRVETDTMAIPSPVVLKYSVHFEEFWRQSTRRGSKVEAYREWGKLRTPQDKYPEILKGMADWMQSEQWQDETKQPHICRWLKRRGWEESIPRSGGARAAAEHRAPHGPHFCQTCAPSHSWECKDPDICGMQKVITCPDFALKFARR